jgi:serine/threonine protein kinase
MAEASIKITASGAAIGTPAYMSPEQGAGSNIDNRSDIYSLGIILYEMVTGRVPYTAETPVAVVFKHIQDPLPSARKLKPDLPEAVELVLLKALAKNPEDRYQNAEDFVHAIQKAVPENETVSDSISQPSISIAPQASTNNFQLGQPQSVKFTPESKTVTSKPVQAHRFPIWAFVSFAFIAYVPVNEVFHSASVDSKETGWN